MTPIPVVDVFAGPGGLNEGFSALKDVHDRVFSTVASVEMDSHACSTLRLRAALRRAVEDGGAVPPVYADFLAGDLRHEQLVSHPTFARFWKHAVSEVRQHELGEKTRSTSDAFISASLRRTLERDEPWVLVGGPPCQAYSLVGRSRRKHDERFKEDHKHTLYREYLHLIATFRPTVFVMENVKGMLSSQHDGGDIFRAITSDLTQPTPDLKYTLHSCVMAHEPGELSPTDFIVRAEQYGVPQARHRVILVGIRSDIDSSRFAPLAQSSPVSVEEIIGDMPKIRSGVSPRGLDDEETWLSALRLAATHAKVRLPANVRPPELSTRPIAGYTPALNGDLGTWLRGHGLPTLVQHESRHHMPLDLARYAYLAFKAGQGQQPKVIDLPRLLQPNHNNLQRPAVPFADRFRVQRRNMPSTTVTSHIAKDGHYFIHHDPMQMRSLTVREAARLQTFPDDYFFMGGRTHQYHQVGNAVPPFLARQIGTLVARVLGRDL